MARLLLRFEESCSAAGMRDLPSCSTRTQEATFTLVQLDAMLATAGLRPIGVFFPNAASDARARAAFRAADGGRMHERDPRQESLANWHALECADVDLFGRMHVVHAQKVER